MSDLDDPIDSALRDDDERDARVARERQIEADDLRWLLADKRGRRVVSRVLARTGVWRTTYRETDRESIFLEGQRNEGLRWLAEMQEHAPERLIQMLQENRGQ